MTPNVAVASERCSRAPESVDAFALADRGKLVVLVSAPRGASGGAARATVRGIQDRIEHAQRTGIDLDGIATASVAAELTAAALHSATAGAAVMVVRLGLEYIVGIATCGMRCYRLRRERLSNLAAGATSEAEPLFAWVQSIEAGDVFLCCTEGLFTSVSEGQIHTALRDNYHPKDVAWSLVEAARTVELRADVTAIVVRPADQRSVATRTDKELG